MLFSDSYFILYYIFQTYARKVRVECHLREKTCRVSCIVTMPNNSSYHCHWQQLIFFDVIRYKKVSFKNSFSTRTNFLVHNNQVECHQAIQNLAFIEL